MIKIPFLELKKRKIVLKDRAGSADDSDLFEKIYKYGKIYFLDQDGINKNKPNYCTYQRLSSSAELWVDAGPRDIGDVVDLIMSGVSKIVIREELWSELDFQSIKKYTEIEIYKLITNFEEDKHKPIFSDTDFNGLIILGEKSIAKKLQETHKTKKSDENNKIYVYITNKQNATYWKEYKVDGLIINIEDMEKYNKI